MRTAVVVSRRQVAECGVSRASGNGGQQRPADACTLIGVRDGTSSPGRGNPGSRTRRAVAGPRSLKHRATIEYKRRSTREHSDYLS